MTEEEMRAKILSLEEQIKSIETEKSTIESEKKEIESKYQTDIEMSEKRINDLKEYNRELFMRVTTKVEETEKEEQEKDDYSLDNLLSDLEK